MSDTMKYFSTYILPGDMMVIVFLIHFHHWQVRVCRQMSVQQRPFYVNEDWSLLKFLLGINMEGNEVSWSVLCMSEIRLARTSSENDVWYLPRYIYAYVIYICACSANIWITISVVFVCCEEWIEETLKNWSWRSIEKLVFNN